MGEHDGPDSIEMGCNSCSFEPIRESPAFELDSTKYFYLMDLIENEISFHKEAHNPWYWRLIHRMFRRRLPNEVLVGELEYLKHYIEDLQKR